MSWVLVELGVTCAPLLPRTASLVVSVAEVTPQGGALVECSEIGHALCFDALQVNHRAIVPANEHGCANPTSTSEVNGAERRRFWAVRHDPRGRMVPRQCRGESELLRWC